MPHPSLSTAATARELRRLGLVQAQAPAFSFADGTGKEPRTLAYGWHRHANHQLLYAFHGTVRLETAEEVWLLPPHRAAWIPAGARHRTILAGVSLGNVYFDPKRYPSLGGERSRIRVFAAPPLLREMIGYSLRWTNKPRRAEERRYAADFFATLAQLCRTLCAEPRLPYSLPRIGPDRLRAAAEQALSTPGAAALADVARAAALSERTFRRRFHEAAGMTWREYALRARLLLAMEKLAGGKENVTETALAVGFNSLSAFGKAFAGFTGETPNAFRLRSLSSPADPASPASSGTRDRGRRSRAHAAPRRSRGGK
ncbi:transcriptional regulator, AraC family [Verrucomicrobium sp. GAS474]|uniref:AraC family transcriptional regulator n=1 Tax=Verrucomicrobium sp. GAS474 TaxID=1882831 RepID=UPI00087CCBF1|nr:helix-turn-helix transcriptional regulator [Verrucomicrobium sp. GAS474]SDU00405.1 transcriptional regulator, AraC family [Verrucomicrobium sp. GAS474]